MAEKQKGNFIDPDFPTTTKSIGNIQSSEIVGDIEWLRPKQFMDHAKLFENGTSTEGIQQGYLGDSYFVGSLSALAENPKRLFNVIRRIGNGKYEVKTYFKGTFQTVIIDDFIPCWNKKPAFTQSKGNELWPMLLEKAYAKLAGSYGAIEGGTMLNMLNSMTGMPIRMFKNDEYKPEELFKKIQNYLKKGYTFISYNDIASPEKAVEMKEQLGLLTHRSYTVIGAHEFDGKFFIEIRNPWTDFTWKGKWRMDDPDWTETMCETMKVNKESKDIFFMELKDFIEFFTTMNVLYYKEHLKCYKSFQIQVSKKQTCIPMSSTGECMVTVIQPDQQHQLGIRMWCIDEHDQPVGGGSGKDFSLAMNLRGSKMNFKETPNARLLVEVYGGDIAKLPGKLQITIRSTDPVTVGKPTNIHPDDYIGYGTKEDAAKADKCVACGYPLTLDGIMESEKLGKYHDKCFRCSTCRCKIDEDYYIIDGKPYCDPCSDLVQ